MSDQPEATWEAQQRRHRQSPSVMIALIALASSSSAYSPQFHAATRPAVLRGTALSMAVPLNIQGKDVSDALKAHAEAKLSVPLEKFKGILNDGKDVEIKSVRARRRPGDGRVDA